MKRLIPVLREDGVDSDLIMVIRTILAASKELAFRISQGALSDVLGSTLDENIQGETQKKLDVIANQLFKELLQDERDVKAIASEEEDDIVAVNESGKYIVAFDPLDGSSNVDINGQIGTIFTIFNGKDDIPASDWRQFAQTGNEQICAGYVLYGPSTLLVMSTGIATRVYTLDLTHGGFLLTIPELNVPEQTAEFSINMANQHDWLEQTKHYINGLLTCNDKRYNMRWNAAMVGDIHRVLTRGGVFLYPQDIRPGYQQGKLRLLYEAFPMAYLMRDAHGKESTGDASILTQQLAELHQRIPVVMGSASEVNEYQRLSSVDESQSAEQPLSSSQAV
ncbi:class 1 fructose-bisphosphatase [Thalassotalea sp. HSM 43]|uniref:class 1 fructose-bisphosphatase n=1 Tax=Thalassotalea sp. HSM 43 TaxID=2552945 RepID=UPI0010815E9C|nr:class 1 fructose-bisphosphatase [Thalassotalea sp. HSM 43]QBY03674.1 class 1 fructose-bisphosphatase [Thalassotalea sp. HSM 43]